MNSNPQYSIKYDGQSPINSLEVDEWDSFTFFAWKMMSGFDNMLRKRRCVKSLTSLWQRLGGCWTSQMPAHLIWVLLSLPMLCKDIT